MDDATVFDGSAGTDGGRGRGGCLTARDRRAVRRQPELRGQAGAAWRQKGTLAPDPAGGGRRAKLADHAELVHALLAAAPDITLAELRSRLVDENIEVSPSAISRFLKACGLTRKKRPRTPPSRSARTSPPRGAPGANSSRR
jgi:hypothetical protein